MSERIPTALGETDLRYVERNHPDYDSMHLHGGPPKIHVLQWRRSVLADHEHQIRLISEMPQNVHVLPAVMWSAWQDVRIEREQP
jgi:hypothetical protein